MNLIRLRDMKTKEKMQWELIEAVALIRRLNPIALTLDHALAITGGVLFTGYSSNDLDIICYPLSGVDADYMPLLELFTQEFKDSEMRVVTAGRKETSKLIFAMKLADGRRIEIFFPSRSISNRIDNIPAFESKTTTY